MTGGGGGQKPWKLNDVISGPPLTGMKKLFNGHGL